MTLLQGSLFTQVQLKGENYDEWARSLRTALRARKKFGFINGTIKQPVETITRGKEERNEIMSFAVQTGRKSYSKTEGKDRNIICSNCNRSGHDSENCFQLIRYPGSKGERPREIG